jgi:aryl-alcohol dehydrogenase-like predicted oxidoreductase
MSMDPTTTAIGTWSGGRFMHFGEPLEDERLRALVRPGGGIDTVITADAYGAGEADSLLGEALTGVERESYCLIGAIGHDFYRGAREGAKGYPRFTDARLRGPEAYGDYIRMATERSLERLGVQQLDVLLLHNPDRTGYTSEAVWEGMVAVREEGLTRMLGVAPGPANGFTLDVIDCMERYGEVLEWAMIILSPMEPWPGELVLGAAEANGVKVITRVVDYGGVFHDDVKAGHEFAEWDHRKFRPPGWVEKGVEKLEQMRPYAERHGLSMLQLACAWNLAHEAVACVAPTLIQEARAGARPIEEKRAELAALPVATRLNEAEPSPLPPVPRPNEAEPSPLPPVPLLSEAEMQELRAIGDNTGSMALKGASAAHEGEPAPDRWPLSEELNEVAARWEITPERDLAMAHN